MRHMKYSGLLFKGKKQENICSLKTYMQQIKKKLIFDRDTKSCDLKQLT